MFQLEIKDFQLFIKNEDESEIFKCETTEKDIKFDIYGIYGAIEYKKQKYLISITKAKSKGQIHDNEVFEIKECKVLVIGPESIEKTDKKKLIKQIEKFFGGRGMYFSEFQIYKRYTEIEGFEAKTPVNSDEKLKNIDNVKKFKEEHLKDEVVLTREIDSNTLNDLNEGTLFLFNKLPIDNLLKLNSLEFENKVILKCIQGYFASYKDFVLISRRSHKRTGARYFSRGLGNQGFPSNFVETEQILLNKNSFLQIRGSIPLKWSHSVDFKYSPKLIIVPSPELFSYSHKLLEYMYKVPIIYLNLIKDTGYESEIYKEFNKHHKNEKIQHIDLHNFNFHKEIFKKEFPFNFQKVGFTSKNNDQKEIIRTNCIDCLDRTNSMQFLIGERLFELQLADANINDPKEIKKYREAHKKAYLANGNYISLQYAGTNAMSSRHIKNFKSEGEVTGVIKSKNLFRKLKNSKLFQLLKDLKYSLHRYYLNRFTHGRHHTILNILTRNEMEETTQNTLRSKPFNFSKFIKLSLFVPLVFLILKKSSSLSILKILALTIMLFIAFLCLSFSIDLPELIN